MRAALPMLPAARRRRITEATGVDAGLAATVVELDLDSLVMAAVAARADGRRAVNRAVNEVAADLDAARRLDPDAFTKLLRLEDEGRLTATQAKQVLAELLASGGDPEAIARDRGFEAMGADALASAVDAAIGANPGEWERFKAGDAKVTGFFVGQVMRATGGKADGKAVTALLRERAAGG